MVKDLITTTEAAGILGCDPSTLRHRIRNGRLKTERVGRDHLVSRKVIEIEAHDKAVKNGDVITLIKSKTRKPTSNGRAGRKGAGK